MAEFKYRVGDRVRIKEDLTGHCAYNGTSDMKAQFGKIVTILEKVTISNTGIPVYRIKEADWCWWEDMFVDEATVEPEEGFNGKVICVETDYSWWTIGKIYTIKNGRFKCDDSLVYPSEEYPPYTSYEDAKHAGDGGVGTDKRHSPKNTFLPVID
jgi:hypothetical protein